MTESCGANKQDQSKIRLRIVSLLRRCEALTVYYQRNHITNAKKVRITSLIDSITKELKSLKTKLIKQNTK